MKDWPWQKWLGRALPFALAVVAAAWKLLAPDDNPTWEPQWWAVVSTGLIGVVNTILSLFPVKQD